MAHALADTGARILILERGDFVRRRTRTGIRRPSGRLRYQTTSAGSTARPRVSPLHALQRRRQHQVLGQRALSAAARRFPASSTWTECPRRGRSTTTRWRRTTNAPSVCIRCTASRRDPTEPARGSVSAPPGAPCRGMATIVQQLRALGLHPSPLPLGIRDGCRLCNTCNSFACKVHAKSEAEVCCVRPALERPNVELWTHAFAGVWSPTPQATRSRPSRSSAKGAMVSRASLFVASCGAVNSAALLLRSANDTHPNGPREFVRARRPPLHGASCDHDAGLSSVPEKRDRIPEDRRDQRLLLRGPAHRTPRPDPIPGADARVMAQTVVP